MILTELDVAIPFCCPKQRNDFLSCPFFAGTDGRYAKCEYWEKRYYYEKDTDI